MKTAGALIAVTGAVLSVAALRRRITPEIAWLGIGSGVSLAAIDLVYVRRKVILPIYLLDAIAEIVLVGAWAAGLRQSRASHTESRAERT